MLLDFQNNTVAKNSSLFFHKLKGYARDAAVIKEKVVGDVKEVLLPIKNMLNVEKVVNVVTNPSSYREIGTNPSEFKRAVHGVSAYHSGSGLQNSLNKFADVGPYTTETPNSQEIVRCPTSDIGFTNSASGSDEGENRIKNEPIESYAWHDCHPYENEWRTDSPGNVINRQIMKDVPSSTLHSFTIGEKSDQDVFHDAFTCINVQDTHIRKCTASTCKFSFPNEDSIINFGSAEDFETNKLMGIMDHRQIIRSRKSFKDQLEPSHLHEVFMKPDARHFIEPNAEINKTFGEEDDVKESFKDKMNNLFQTVQMSWLVNKHDYEENRCSREMNASDKLRHSNMFPRHIFLLEFLLNSIYFDEKLNQEFVAECISKIKHSWEPSQKARKRCNPLSCDEDTFDIVSEKKSTVRKYLWIKECYTGSVDEASFVVLLFILREIRKQKQALAAHYMVLTFKECNVVNCQGFHKVFECENCADLVKKINLFLLTVRNAYEKQKRARGQDLMKKCMLCTESNQLACQKKFEENVNETGENLVDLEDANDNSSLMEAAPESKHKDVVITTTTKFLTTCGAKSFYRQGLTLTQGICPSLEKADLLISALKNYRFTFWRHTLTEQLMNKDEKSGVFHGCDESKQLLCQKDEKYFQGNFGKTEENNVDLYPDIKTEGGKTKKSSIVKNHDQEVEQTTFSRQNQETCYISSFASDERNVIVTWAPPKERHYYSIKIYKARPFQVLQDIDNIVDSKVDRLGKKTLRISFKHNRGVKPYQFDILGDQQGKKIFLFSHIKNGNENQGESMLSENIYSGFQLHACQEKAIFGSLNLARNGSLIRINQSKLDSGNTAFGRLVEIKNIKLECSNLQKSDLLRFIDYFKCNDEKHFSLKFWINVEVVSHQEECREYAHDEHDLSAFQTSMWKIVKIFLSSSTDYGIAVTIFRSYSVVKFGEHEVVLKPKQGGRQIILKNESILKIALINSDKKAVTNGSESNTQLPEIVLEISLKWSDFKNLDIFTRGQELVTYSTEARYALPLMSEQPGRFGEPTFHQFDESDGSFGNFNTNEVTLPNRWNKVFRKACLKEISQHDADKIKPVLGFQTAVERILVFHEQQEGIKNGVPPTENYQNFELRRRTFLSNDDTKSCAENLARAGFYLNQNEVLTCFSCGSASQLTQEIRRNAFDFKLHHPDCLHIQRFSHTIQPSNQKKQLSDVEADGSISDDVRDPPGQQSIYIPPGDVRREAYRLSTYEHYPVSSPISRKSLARAGFYFTGFFDRVKCFSCARTVERWNDIDSPTDIRWHKSDCLFARNHDSGNIPIRSLFERSSNQAGPSRNQEEVLQQRDATGEVVRTVRYPADLPERVRQTGGTFEIGPNNTIRIQTGPGQNTRNVGGLGSQPPQPRRWRMANVISSDHRRFLTNLHLNRELDRLASFARWPVGRPSVSPAALARTGFFYLGDMDRTQCFSCGGVLRNWTLEDDAMAEHRSHFPNCKMILGTEQRNYKVNEFPDPPADRARDYPCRFPSNPHMRNEVARQDTFDRRWPVGRTAATPAEISQAGFFFLGERDRVKCWYCNGGLQNWEYDDMPWIEHAKWFPTCQFLLQVKGQHFVYRHLTMNPHLARPIIAKQDGATVDPTGGNAGGTGGSGQGNVDIPPGGPADRQPEPTPEIIDPQVEMRKRKERVKTTMEKSDLVKSILLMGFDEKIVAALLEDKIESGNVENPDDIYDSMSSLLDDVMKKEQEIKEEESQMQAAVQIPAVMNVGGATSMAFQSYNSAYSSMSTPMSSLGPSPGSGKYQVSLIDDNEEPMDEDMYGSVEAGPSTTEVTPAKQLLNAEENSESLQQQLEKIEEERMCKICFSNPADMVFIPCSHMICCMECTQAIRHCPVCRKKIEKAIKTYAN
uniref:uncharacterized protein LOC120334396 n=1 Tax=Styela clava TaxID=7725 RepID=UPI001939BAD8|nr:uncharacterized protein LOC120334396 [Styela clava]